MLMFNLDLHSLNVYIIDSITHKRRPKTMGWVKNMVEKPDIRAEGIGTGRERLEGSLGRAGMKADTCSFSHCRGTMCTVDVGVEVGTNSERQVTD